MDRARDMNFKNQQSPINNPKFLPAPHPSKKETKSNFFNFTLTFRSTREYSM